MRNSVWIKTLEYFLRDNQWLKFNSTNFKLKFLPKMFLKVCHKIQLSIVGIYHKNHSTYHLYKIAFLWLQHLTCLHYFGSPLRCYSTKWRFYTGRPRSKNSDFIATLPNLLWLFVRRTHFSTGVPLESLVTLDLFEVV